MKTILNEETRREIYNRIDSLTNSSRAVWGKMNVHQMIKHAYLCDDMYLGKQKIKRVLIGRLIGKMIMNKILKDDKPFGKDSPTSPLLKVEEVPGNIDVLKREWKDRIKQYESYSKNDFIHPFFGPMTIEQVGIFVYKHADHHLRQFGA